MSRGRLTVSGPRLGTRYLLVKSVATTDVPPGLETASSAGPGRVAPRDPLELPSSTGHCPIGPEPGEDETIRPWGPRTALAGAGCHSWIPLEWRAATKGSAHANFRKELRTDRALR